MLNLPSKTPGDRFDYGWDIPLDTADTVSSATIELRSGDVVLEGQSLDVANARLTFVLSGGTAGTSSLFYVRAETAGGDIIDDFIGIYVGGTIVPRPTPDDIKAEFPEFAQVDEGVIQRRIDRTASRVDASWGDEMAWGKSLLTAHYLVEDGFGGGDAEIAAYRAAGVVKLKSGTLDVTFASATEAGAGEFDSTVYGRRFYALMRRLFSGPLTTGGGCYGYAGAATDLPFAWAYGGRCL
jgi:hypothetical protein